MKTKIILFYIFFVVSFLKADVLTFSTDNDLFFQSDDTYTAALFLSWTGEEYKKADKDSFTYHYTCAFKNIINTLPLLDLDKKNINANISVQEIIFTPNDLSKSEPIYNDVQYSGTLALHFSLYSWDDTTFDSYRFSVGLVGPLSGAQHIQKVVHKITASEEPKGWDNQIDNYLAFNLGYLKGYKTYEHKLSYTTRIEWFNSTFLDLGSYYAGAGFGTLVRFGKNMPYNFNTPSALMSVTPTNHLNFKARNKELGWAVNIGTFVNYINYMYTHEISQKNGYKTESDAAIFLSGKLSFDLFYKDLQASLEFYPTRSKVTVKNTASWGRISFTWSL